MVEVDFSTRSTQPYIDIGLIIVTWADGTKSTGTCSLVGRNDILTAGHCVYSPDNGGWAESFEFFFGTDYNQSTGQFQSIISEPQYSKWTATAWTSQIYSDGNNSTMLQSESQYDVALIGIDNAIGDTLGWLGLAPQYNGTQVAVAVGYPAGSTGMMMQTTSVKSSPGYGIYESSSEVMGPGSSGGPLLIGNHVIGVKSTGVWWADLGNSYIYDALVDELSDNNDLIDAKPTPEEGKTVIGTAGSDILTGTSGNDIIDGGNGIDTVVLGSQQANYTLTKTVSGWTVSSSVDGTDTLTKIERLQFADKKIALDLTPEGLAGQAMGFIGVVAPDLLNNTTVRGTIISLFDQGQTMESLSQLALDLNLLPTTSSVALANAVYHNVLGGPASADMTDVLVGYIEDHGQADFVATVAGLHINVDLVGLQQTGVEYLV